MDQKTAAPYHCILGLLVRLWACLACVMMMAAAFIAIPAGYPLLDRRPLSSIPFLLASFAAFGWAMRYRDPHFATFGSSMVFIVCWLRGIGLLFVYDAETEDQFRSVLVTSLLRFGMGLTSLMMGFLTIAWQQVDLYIRSRKGDL